MESADPAILAAAVDALADGLVVLSEDGTVLWRRRSPALRLAATEDAETIGAGFFDRVHPDDLPAVLAALERLKSGEASEVELSLRSYDPADPTVIHDQDVIAIDARHLPGVNGILAIALLRDTRRAFSDHVHGDDFSLAETAPVGLAILTPACRIIFANHTLRDHLGLQRRTALAVTSVAGLHELVAEARTVVQSECNINHRGRTLRASARRFGSSDNIVLTTTDVTVEIEAIAAQRRSEELWRATFLHTPAGIAIVTVDGDYVEVNPAWSAITGYSSEEMAGRSFSEITHQDDLTVDEEYVEELLRGERETFRMEKRYLHRTGQVLWADVWVSLVRDAAGAPVHLVAQIRDITEAKQVEDELLARERRLSHDATHDHLTGLPNRALLREHLRVAVARAARRDDHTSLVSIDVDGFGAFNRQYGREVGNRVLSELGERLSAVCRRGDVVARVGDDEFMVVADPVYPDTDGRQLAERLLVVLSQPLLTTPRPVALTASVGLTVVAGDDTVDGLLTRVEGATAIAAEDGGNSVVFVS